jgi:8-oxo-dGTP pyrophosphatase MutT (NUDIX family)
MKRQSSSADSPVDVGHREFAAAILIDTQRRLLFQQRDNTPGILYPGWVGLFGGHREGNESFLECVCREILEEIGYRMPPDRFEPMASYSGIDPGGGTVVGEFFVARDIPADALVVTEGSLLIVTPDELPSLVQRLAPSASYAVRIFTNNQRR